ncbi:MAG: sigma-70 family RNA polymerase sigma factor [Coprobacillus sp.]
MEREICGQSYELMIIKYSDLVTRICFLHLHNQDDVKDCFQDTFIKLYKYKKDFKDEEHLKAWLIRVTINTCKDFQRRNYKYTVDIDKVAIQVEDQYFEVLPILITLDNKYKLPLYLYYYEGYSIEEIATILKINSNTIKSQLSRGRTILKERLGDDYA